MIAVFRKELKYLLFQHEFAAMRPALSTLLRRDENGRDFGYTVRSLYFDSIYDRDYYDTVDGLLEKAKIRLRIYSGSDMIKLEFKTKTGDNSKKYSLSVSKEEAQNMLKCDYGFLADRPEPIARTMYMRLLQGAYQPKTLVEYEREAYTFPAGDVRVTFDTNVRGTASDWDLFSDNPPFTTLIQSGTGVLEVKYTSVLPPFIKEIVQTGHLSAANSKYVQARQFYQFGGK